jgi:hypothetical protein
MSDETASALLKYAKERLLELLQQESSVKDQISHWTSVVEGLAKLSGEEIEPEIASRIKQLNQESQGNEAAAGVGTEMGLTEAIRWVFRQPLLLPLTPTQVRDRLAEMGYDLEKYAHVMPPIHNTLKRMRDAGEIREVEGIGGLGKAFESSK